MDEILLKLETKFHPLQDLDFKYVNEISLVNRKNIRILSYNIFLRPPPIKNNEDDYKNERLANFIHCLEDYDVVCLQEMFGSYNFRKQNIIKLAKKCGFFFVSEPPLPSFFSSYMVDGGLLILSRFPIIKSEFLPFGISVMSDSLSEKGMLYARIQIKDTILHIITTHFQASYFGSSDSNWKLSIRARLEQMNELCNYIKNLKNEKNISNKDTFILCGDFNVDFHQFEKMKKIKKITLESDVDEYEKLISKLSEISLVRDIFKEHHKINPYTFGVNGENYEKFDKVLTDKDDFGSFQTLDYFFELIFTKKDTYSNFKRNLNILTTTAKVEPFHIENKPYQTLSDHLGLSVEIEYIK